MSSKAALSILVKAVSSRAFVPIVLHMDATYKLNINEFPVNYLKATPLWKQWNGLCPFSHKQRNKLFPYL